MREFLPEEGSGCGVEKVRGIAGGVGIANRNYEENSGWGKTDRSPLYLFGKGDRIKNDKFYRPMKALQTPDQIMRELVGAWNHFYPEKSRKKEGCIGLCLSRKWYYIEMTREEIELKEQTDLEVKTTLSCTFEDWMLLLSKPSFLWWGMMRRRLIFKGNISFFRYLPKVNFDRYVWDRKDVAREFERFPAANWKIPEKILMINASPRAEQGYTYFLAEQLVKGMRKVCPQVKVVQLVRQSIRECRGCWYCWQKGRGRCLFEGEDDCRELLDSMQESDLILFAFPLYSDGVPSALKNFFDRKIATLEPFMTAGPLKTRHPRRIAKDQAMAVLSVCGFVEKSHFKAVREHFRALAHNWHMPLVAEIYRPAVLSLFNNPLFYRDQRKLLSLLEQSGEMLVRKGRIPSRTKRKIERDFISCRKFRGSANYFWLQHLNEQGPSAY